MAKKFEMRNVRGKKRSAKHAKSAKGKERKRKVIKGSRRDELMKLAEAGARNSDLAKAAKMSEATFYRLMKFDPTLEQELKGAKDVADAKVLESLYAKARGWEYDEVTYEPKLVVRRQVKGEQQEVVINEELVVTKRIPKAEPPDTKAIMFWLTNRQRKDWKNRTLNGMDPENPVTPPVVVLPGFKGGLKNGVIAFDAVYKKP